MKDRNYVMAELRHREFIERELRRGKRRDLDTTSDAQAAGPHWEEGNRQSEREACKKCAA